MSYPVRLRKVFQKRFEGADIKIDGDRPWDITVRNPSLYARVLAKGSLGLGEAYMDGWWDCESLDQFFSRISSGELDGQVKPLSLMVSVLISKIMNLQTPTRSKTVGEHHYDLGNEFYKNMLDKRLVYTCGYWAKANTLDEAQTAKLDLVCKKIGLKKGQRVLDIGGGWGSFAKFAAENYQAEIVSITISTEQVALGKKLCADLPGVEIRLQDYRDLIKKGKASEKFDHIVSLGMFEHVGPKNYKTFMETANRLLKDGGLFLLHTIGTYSPNSDPLPWITKYIFPGGVLPSAGFLVNASDGSFKIEDWHNFGADYDTTLMAWNDNFTRNWSKTQNDHDERFKRMWQYYLLSCAGAFRSRSLHLWQIVFSKSGVRGGYTSIR